MLLGKIIILFLLFFIIGIIMFTVIYVIAAEKGLLETNFDNYEDEKQALKNYQKAANKMCEDCEYQCEFRGKRDELKMQRTGHREIRRKKEWDEYESYVIKKKLP